MKISNSFTILFAVSLLSQLFSLLIKINELNTDNILDNPRELITLAREKYSFPGQSHWPTDKNIHQAKEKAVQWLQNDLFVLFVGEQVLFAQGNQKVLNSSTAAVLNSSDGIKLKPSGEEIPGQQPISDLSEYLFHYTHANNNNLLSCSF